MILLCLICHFIMVRACPSSCISSLKFHVPFAVLSSSIASFIIFESITYFGCIFSSLCVSCTMNLILCLSFSYSMWLVLLLHSLCHMFAFLI